jgi:hypothetical protein
VEEDGVNEALARLDTEVTIRKRSGRWVAEIAHDDAGHAIVIAHGPTRQDVEEELDRLKHLAVGAWLINELDEIIQLFPVPETPENPEKTTS